MRAGEVQAREMQLDELRADELQLDELDELLRAAPWSSSLLTGCNSRALGSGSPPCLSLQERRLPSSFSKVGSFAFPIFAEKMSDIASEKGEFKLHQLSAHQSMMSWVKQHISCCKRGFCVFCQ